MRRARRQRRPWAAVPLLALAACAVPRIDSSPQAAARVRAQDLGTLPYHPLVYHLDLAVLTYQLYGQSLAWPFDPYYEDARDRDEFMARVRQWAQRTGAEQVARRAGIDGYRGPGVLGGFDDNPSHDPIVYQYSRLHPWSDTVTNPDGSAWVEYRVPARITRRIRQVVVCARATGATLADYNAMAPGSVEVAAVAPGRDDAAPDARDVLMAFEGGTGDKGIAGQPASQSLMGFALLRTTVGDAYDVHIAFRGSRSGSAARAFLQAWSSGNAAGNPDWITDLGYDEQHRPEISAVAEHRVARGMATSVGSIVPTLFRCLEAVAGARAVGPTNIYVTGHSLGGALAQQFASAVLLGDRYGATGTVMPPSLRTWPWQRLKLVTFGAPRVGNEAWAQALTATRLAVQPFVGDIASPYDLAATGVTDDAIVPRLGDPARPAGYRVLIPNDPITTARVVGGTPVGHTIYVAQPSEWDIYAPPEARAHEPVYIRQFMVDTLRDDRRLPDGQPLVPPSSWAYRAPSEIEPERDAAAAGTTAEYDRLAAAIRRYYASRGLWFDREAFDAGYATFVGFIR